MNPDDIKALRKHLGCTAKQLAASLQSDQATVLAWERGELFPTKRNVTAMEALRASGRPPAPKKPTTQDASPISILADPVLWTLVRKLLVHADLRAAVLTLAASFSDPSPPTLPPNSPSVPL